MAFSAEYLNNIAPSTGGVNIWIYETNDNLTAISTAHYFDDGREYGMRHGDIVHVAYGVTRPVRPADSLEDYPDPIKSMTGITTGWLSTYSGGWDLKPIIVTPDV